MGLVRVCPGAGVEVGDPAELPLGQAVWPQICKCVFKENWDFFHVPIFQHSLEERAPRAMFSHSALQVALGFSFLVSFSPDPAHLPRIPNSRQH